MHQVATGRDWLPLEFGSKICTAISSGLLAPGRFKSLRGRVSYPDSHSLSHKQEREDRNTIVQAPRIRRERISTITKGRSQRDVQVVIQPECPVAIRAFPRSRQSPFLDTGVAEDVPAGLDNRVLEVLLADGTNRHNLPMVSGVGKRETRLINSPEASRTRCFGCLNPYSSTTPGFSLSPPSAL